MLPVPSLLIIECWNSIPITYVSSFKEPRSTSIWFWQNCSQLSWDSKSILNEYNSLSGKLQSLWKSSIATKKSVNLWNFRRATSSWDGIATGNKRNILKTYLIYSPKKCSRRRVRHCGKGPIWNRRATIKKKICLLN